jgi:hypothetical protein
LLKIDRTWKNADRIELVFDMPLRLAPLDSRHPDLVALMRGPVALFAIQPVPQKVSKQALLSARRASASSTDWLVTTGGEPLIMKPFPAITAEHYRLYQQV